jgi:hypothetical protein
MRVDWDGRLEDCILIGFMTIILLGVSRIVGIEIGLPFDCGTPSRNFRLINSFLL